MCRTLQIIKQLNLQNPLMLALASTLDFFCKIQRRGVQKERCHSAQSFRVESCPNCVPKGAPWSWNCCRVLAIDGGCRS